MDGKGHAKIARRVLIVESVAGAVLFAYGEPWAGVGLVFGGIGGLLVTPDADHHVKTYEEDRWDNVPILGKYLQGVWAGYGSKYKHRGRSHWHVWGTMTRWFYFGRRFMADALFAAYVVFVILLGGVFDGQTVAAAFPYLPRGGFVFFMFAGWTLQDSVHIETDRVWSWWRSKRGRRFRRRAVRFVLWVIVFVVIALAAFAWAR